MKEALEEHGYQVMGKLGSGATAEVFCVRERRSGVNFACKAGKRTALARRETCLLGALGHPLFPRWKEAWEQGDMSFLVMEYIPGICLEHYVKHRGKARVRQAVRIGLELAEGIGYLQERNDPILYRDLKPCHVILQADGRARLLDLGAACRLSESGRSRAGTPGYAAPEQLAENGRADQASEIYALGKLLHFLLTGKDPCVPPFEAAPVRRYAPESPPGLEQAVARCLAEDPRERIPDMRRLIRLLAPFAQTSPGKRFFPGWELGIKGEHVILRYEKNIRKTAEEPYRSGNAPE